MATIIATGRVAGRSPAMDFILVFVAGLKASCCKRNMKKCLMRLTDKLLRGTLRLGLGDQAPTFTNM